MHAVQEGAANRSFGLQVAQLAGVPRTVIVAAKHKLAELEAGESRPVAAIERTETQLDFIQMSDPLGEALDSIEPDELSPKQALEKLYELKRLVRLWQKN
jgi:DNA mismatch repair protein MutS